jgi:hypothetical protein
LSRPGQTETAHTKRPLRDHCGSVRCRQYSRDCTLSITSVYGIVPYMLGPSHIFSATQAARCTTLRASCIRSESGKYLLESKRHKKIWLSGPVEFAPHTGHAVILHGSFLNESASTNTSPANQRTAAEPSATRQENNFQVAKIEMVSDSCTLKNTKGIKGSSDQP